MTASTASAVSPLPGDGELSLEHELHNRSRRGVLSWSLYDLANTIFSFNVVSYVAPLWVLAVYKSVGRGDGEANLAIGLAVALSMLINAIVSPVLGALSDRAGVRKPFLLVFTILCIVPTLFIGFVDAGVGAAVGGTYLWLGLGVFAFANFSYQAALIYYDAMLPAVSTEQNRGRIGGIGVGLGYVGTIIGALSVRALTFENGEPTAASFVLSGVLFAVFAIPIFLVIRERRPRSGVGIDFVGSWKQLVVTIRHASEFPGLLRFLVARLLYTDPINTVISFMAIYATQAVGFSPRRRCTSGRGHRGGDRGRVHLGPVTDRIGPSGRC
jgi:UMF1 family MFS transporter